MRTRFAVLRLMWTVCAMMVCVSVAHAQIHVTEARIGCLDSPTANQGNLTGIVGSACNGKFSCSYKAPTEAQYKSMGVQAHTKPFCTQAMEITYQCGTGATKSVTVPGDAWTHGPADLECPAPISSGGGGNPAGSPFPITRSQLDPIAGIGYMQTNVTISGSGQLTATTHTWSAKELEGFHGSVAVVALDGNQALLWVSPTQTYGVDQKACPPFSTCHSDRTDNWSATIPGQVFSRTAYIAIKQRYTPKGVTFDDIGNWLRGLGNGIGNELGSIAQSIGHAVAGGGGGGGSQSQGPQQTQSGFPINRSQLDPIAGIGYMHTDITISKNADGSGHLTALTHTWSAKDLEGFHGSVAVVALDANQALLWVSATQTYGVDQKFCPPLATCHSDRMDNWSDAIPAQVLSRTAYIAIKQRYTPKGVTLDNIGNWVRGLGNDVAKELGPILQGIGNAIKDAGCVAAMGAVGGLGLGLASAVPGAAEAAAIGVPGATEVAAVGGTVLLNANYDYPLVAFSEDSVAAFMNALDRNIPSMNLANRNVYIIGGSTGGALTLRMGHRQEPWIKKIVAWNPASVWTTYAHDALKGFALQTGFRRADASEGLGSREDYFNGVFGKMTPVTQPNPEEWYRGNRGDFPANSDTQKPFRSEWRCKRDYIAAARLEMQEVYNPAYRRWHWRLGTELTAFSFFNDDWLGPANTASGKPGKPANYEAIRKPTLLVASDDDDWNVGGTPSMPACRDLHVSFRWENRWTQTRAMAALMHNTPGQTLFLPNTGHSIHNERPNYFASQIVNFLSSSGPAMGPLQVLPTVEESEMQPYDQSSTGQDNCTPQLPQLLAIPPQLLENPDSAAFLKTQANPDGTFDDRQKSNAGHYSPRLRPELRAVARAKNPALALGVAAAYYYLGDDTMGDSVMGNAFADLSVTGRGVYEAFRSNPPTDNQVKTVATNVLPLVIQLRTVAKSGNLEEAVALQLPALGLAPLSKNAPLDQNKLASVVHSARDRAYKVAWALRNPDSEAAYKFRKDPSLKWIAVSGEDDPPDRPVNVPSGIPIYGPDGKTQISAYPQYDVLVSMVIQTASGPKNRISFKIRYSIASPPTGQVSGQAPTSAPYQFGVFAPDPKPVIPAGDDIILYIHGGPGSRLEEASDLVKPLHDHGLARGKRYTVISFDQLSQGYSSMVDPSAILGPVHAAEPVSVASQH